MSSLGSSERRDAFHHDHGLLQQQQFRPRAHVEQAGDLEQQRQQLGHRDVFGGAVVDRLADGADRLREALDRMMPRHVAGVEMHLRGAMIVAGDEAEQDFGEEAPFLRPEPAHDAEVDRDQFAVGVDEQIAGMHVGVEEAVAQRVAQEILDHGAAERRQVEALGCERGVVVERRAVDPFQRQHLARGAVPVDRSARGSPCPRAYSPPSRRARRPPGGNPFRSSPSGPASPPPRPGAAAALRARKLSALRAAKKKASRSDLKRRSTPGRRIFTATGLRAPSFSTSARCTCAIEAAATAGPKLA